MFDLFVGKVKSFYERFFFVRLRSEAALRNVLKTVQRPNDNGGFVSARVHRFHFFWYPDHFTYESKAFGHSFLPAEVVDEEGRRMLDSQGNRVTVPCLINTHDLLLSSNPMELLAGKMQNMCDLLKKDKQKDGWSRHQQEKGRAEENGWHF